MIGFVLAAITALAAWCVLLYALYCLHPLIGMVSVVLFLFHWVNNICKE
jgi:hypothetical protein